MIKSKTVLTVLFACMAIPTVSMAADTPITKSATTEVKATVVAVDQATRLVTLKVPGGT